MTDYLNLKSGNSWTFTGYNEFGPAPVTFKTRFSVDEQSQICGHKVFGWRITKDKPEGYWGPKYHDDNTSGLENNRGFFTVAEASEPWADDGIGMMFNKGYMFDESLANPIASSGASLLNQGRGLNTRHFVDDDLHFFTNTYYAPYFAIPSQVHNGWRAAYEDMLYTTNGTLATGTYCDHLYVPGAGHYFDTSWWVTTVETPAYIGPALRWRAFEAGLPLGGTRWATREDNYFAPGIGLVRLDKWSLKWLCKPPGESGSNQACWDLGEGVTDPGSEMYPKMQLLLANYYIGEPLVVSLDKDYILHQDNYALSAVSQNSSQPYTGKLEVKWCLGEGRCEPTNQKIWDDWHGNQYWLQDGTIKVQVNESSSSPDRTVHMYFRPVVEKVPPDDLTGETVITKTQLPWSNEVILQVVSVLPTATPIPLPGDLNGDRRVDYLDVLGFMDGLPNQTYNLMDFNRVVANYGEVS